MWRQEVSLLQDDPSAQVSYSSSAADDASQRFVGFENLFIWYPECLSVNKIRNLDKSYFVLKFFRSSQKSQSVFLPQCFLFELECECEWCWQTGQKIDKTNKSLFVCYWVLKIFKNSPKNVRLFMTESFLMWWSEWQSVNDVNKLDENYKNWTKLQSLYCLLLSHKNLKRPSVCFTWKFWYLISRITDCQCVCKLDKKRTKCKKFKET